MRLLCLGVAILALIVAPANAQTQRASVSFTDEHPISIKLTDLQKEGLQVALTNLLGESQKVTVSVVGLSPADGFTLGRFADERVTLAPRETFVVKLPWKATGVMPVDRTYEGSVVLVGERGPLVRQALTIRTSAKPAPSVCAAADALEDAGQHDEAKTAYQKILENDPTASCAADALRDRDASATLRDSLDDVTELGLMVLGWLALIAGVIALLVLALGKFVMTRQWLVDLPLVGGWLDRRFAPRVAVQDFGDAKAFTALVRDGLVRHRGDEPYRLDRITARQSLGDRLSSIEAVDPALKTLGAVLNVVEQLMPRAWFTASGSVQGKHVSGEGATVILDGPRESQSATLWLGAIAATDADHQPLAVPVAAWIDCQVNSQLGEPPGVGNAEAYALLQGALECERRGDVANAERLYLRAKAVDPANVPAITNLANLRARGRKEYLQAVRELREAVDTLHAGL